MVRGTRGSVAEGAPKAFTVSTLQAYLRHLGSWGHCQGTLRREYCAPLGGSAAHPSEGVRARQPVTLIPTELPDQVAVNDDMVSVMPLAANEPGEAHVDEPARPFDESALDVIRRQ